MADRCERADLLVDQCACVAHRGGQTPEEQAAAEVSELRSKLLRLPRWFPATYPGKCRCGKRFQSGAAVRFDLYSDTNYRAECCGREDL